MGKVIFWIVIVFVIMFALRLLNVAKARSRQESRKAKGSNAQTMVRCVRCGTFLPRPEATSTPDGFCCREPGCNKHSSAAR
jgi:hypothetical protein